jgi:hypothetical protein
MCKYWGIWLYFINLITFYIWLIVYVILVSLYYLLWIRGIVKGGSFMYGFDTIIIPVPMAILPVVTFFITALLTFNPFLLVSTILLAIGHIVNSINTRNIIFKKGDVKND